MKSLPYGRQTITEEDIEAVVSVLKSDYLTQGPKIAEFEQAFATYVGAKYAVAVSNGTAALHLGALALRVAPGDKVITTPITFAASANCVRYCGGEVVFVDIDPKTLLLDIEKVHLLLSNYPKGTFKGVIPVDFSGLPVNMEAYRRLADEYGLWIMEDACHAPGGFFVDSKNKRQQCGNGAYANLSIFSFHPVKHIATGEGGMITTNEEDIYKRLVLLRTHGITRDETSFENNTSFASGEANALSFPGWYMEMKELGFNYRLTDFQAALGISQLKRADTALEKRRAIARQYDSSFANHPQIQVTQSWSPQSNIGHAYHLYVIQVPDRLGLYNHLRQKSIFAQIHYVPVHLMPYYRRLGWKEGDFPHAEQYYARCLSLPIFPGLTPEDVTYVSDTIIGYYK